MTFPRMNTLKLQLASFTSRAPVLYWHSILLRLINQIMFDFETALFFDKKKFSTWSALPIDNAFSVFRMRWVNVMQNKYSFQQITFTITKLLSVNAYAIFVNKNSECCRKVVQIVNKCKIVILLKKKKSSCCLVLYNFTV